MLKLSPLTNFNVRPIIFSSTTLMDGPTKVKNAEVVDKNNDPLLKSNNNNFVPPLGLTHVACAAALTAAYAILVKMLEKFHVLPLAKGY